MKRLVMCLLLIPCLVGPVAARAPVAPPNAEAALLVELLHHADQGLREEAWSRLMTDKVDATPLLVQTLAGPGTSEKQATLAAIVLVNRLETLRKNPERRPRLALLQDDRDDLQTLVSFLQSPVPAEDWRWYLAASVLDTVYPASTKTLLPVYVDAINRPRPMRTYAAVVAMYHLGPDGNLPEVRAALSGLLGKRDRLPFQGVFMRYKRVVVIDNLVGNTADVGIDYDIQQDNEFFRTQRFYNHDNLLILDTLHEIGAPESLLVPRLAFLSVHPDPDVQLEAARQLVRLGDRTKGIVALALNRMLQTPQSELRRRLANDEVLLRQQLSRKAGEEIVEPETIRLFTRLGPASPMVVPALASLLQNGDPELRHSVAYVLGEMGPRAAEAERSLADALKRESYLRDRLKTGNDSLARRVETMERALRKIAPPRLMGT